MTDRRQPNILILCMDQWDMRMDLPDGVELPALTRLRNQGVTLDRHYCTVPICTPSRTTMWTGQHAITHGLWDNTNFPWVSPLAPGAPTLGTMMRDQGYYTAFKGKWHLSEVLPGTPDALEEYGFSDYQTWGDNWGRPMEGQVKDGTVARETIDWLRHTAPKNEPWLLISSMVNPHDIMFYLAQQAEAGHDKSMFEPMMHGLPSLAELRRWWEPSLPESVHDDLAQQPLGVHNYKEFIELNYTNPPEGAEGDEIFRQRRNYLINCMRLVDWEFAKIFAELDEQGLWDDTVVIFTSDHGEMNGAHGMTQKGGIHYDEATVVNMTAVVPGGAAGVETTAVGSHIDLVPTCLAFAGLDDATRTSTYPDLPGRDLSRVFTDPRQVKPPRGDQEEPGDGALLMWDGLHQLDPDWSVTGAMTELLDLPADDDIRAAKIREVGAKYGAPDFTRRTFYRTVVDGRYKLVRWFSPLEYGTPRSVDKLYETSDVTVHDLVADPAELENIGHPEHPDFNADLVQSLLEKLNALIERELGGDRNPIDLDMFGSHDTKAAPSPAAE